MKILSTLVLVSTFILGTTFTSKAQGFTITSLIDSSTVNGGCDSLLYISMSPMWNTYQGNEDLNIAIVGSNFQAGPVNVSVNWGDGTSTSHTGQMTQQGTIIQFTPTLMHVYPNNPTSGYSVTITASNPNNQSSATTTVYWQQSTGCNSYLYASIGLDCDNDGQIDSTITSNVPFDLISNSGNFYSGIFNQNYAVIQNISPNNYMLQLNQNWLTSNGYVVSSINPANVYMTGGGAYTYSIILNCDSTFQIGGCIEGLLFCDENNNGVFDGNDIGIQNAPISISYGGNTQYTFTGSYGSFYQGYNDPTQGAAVVTVDPAWLGQNGIYLPNNTYTVANITCDSNNLSPIYFAANCDSSNIQNKCVKGVVFCDANGNGVMDNGETTLSNVPVYISNSGAGYNAGVYSDQNGMFVYMNPNLSNFTTIYVSNYWLSQHGYTSNVTMMTVNTNCDSSLIYYYPINCGSGGSGCADLHTEVATWIGYYQNQTNYVKLKWGNYGFSPVGQYKLTLTYPAGVTPNTSSFMNQAYTINGNTVEWILNNNNNNFYNQDVISFFVPSGIPSGTAHYYSSTITPLGSISDCDSTNNQDSLMMILGNSYDPNDKTVNQPEIINPATQDLLEYRIRFQNTGTAPAQDIYIIDTLSALLDWTTFELLDASHNIQVIDLGGGVMKFNFPGIWLPDSTANEPDSHGELRYRIRENAGNGIGTEIHNTAYIYFDWNPAIITNTTINKNMTAGIVELVSQDWMVYPNPTKDVLNIRADFTWENVNVYSVDGKLMLTSDFTNELDLTSLSDGLYVIELQVGTQKVNSRFIKE